MYVAKFFNTKCETGIKKKCGPRSKDHLCKPVGKKVNIVITIFDVE